MANQFLRDIEINFTEMVAGFEDSLVLTTGNKIKIRQTDPVAMSRAGDTTWIPMPYLPRSFSGLDQTSNFQDIVQLSVPVTLGTPQSVPFTLDVLELRDQLRSKQFAKRGIEKLASDVNVSVMNEAAKWATIFVKRTGAAVGHVDMATAAVPMNTQGVPMRNRSAIISSPDYVGMTDNLATRGTVQGKVERAYEDDYIGRSGAFDIYQLDYANTLTAAAASSVTVNGANQYFTPAANQTSGGITAPLDNRYQTLAVTVGSGTAKVGDAFTLAGVNAVNHVTKGDTLQLKTFKIIELLTGSGGTGNWRISPPIISGGGSTAAELQYKNVTATPADGGALTFLNTVSAPQNLFWYQDAIELLPGRMAVPTDSGANVMKATTRNGIEVVMQFQYDIKTGKFYIRLDAFWGVAVTGPEFIGQMLFSQT